MGNQRGPELLRLTCYGQPAGAGSKTAEVVTRGRGGPIVWARGPFIRGHDVIGLPMLRYRPSSKFTEPWMKVVAREAEIAWRGLEPLDGALWIAVDFFETRPKSHFLSGARLRPNAPAHPAVTDSHDRGKLTRAIEDALTNAKVLADDKRVVASVERKHYCDREAIIFESESWREPRAVIRVGRMSAQTVEEAGIMSPAPEGQEQLVTA